MLILLSSGARRRYRDDIIRTLAHPAGTELRFRYGTDHVEASVLADLRTGNLTGQDVLICHLADRKDGKPAALIPCRFATISRAKLVGTSIVLTLATGAYAQQLDDAGLRALMTPEELAQLPNQGSDAKEPPGKFALPIAAPLTSKAAPEAAGPAAFEMTAAALHAAEFGSGDPPTSFYAVRDLIDLDGDGAIERPVVVTNGHYALRSGKRYAIEVYSFAPDSDVTSAAASTLTADANDIDVKFGSEKEAKLDSRYDLNRFCFSTDQRLLELPAGLRLALGVPTLVDGKTVIEQRCDITLELRFSGSKLMIGSRIFLIAIGTAIPAILGAYAAQKASFCLSAAMFAAALVTGIGTVFPFKRN